MLKKISLSLAASAAALALAATAYAATPLSGWAWSSDIGWVSFNSTDSGAGGGPYEVTLSTTTGSSVGTLSGDAWSPNIGWISFNSGDVSGCPTGSCAPTVNMTTGAVSGWAKALAADNNGWDGWIELAGASHPTGDATGMSGVTYVPSTGRFVGYAWGSNVVGWLSFNTGAGGSTGGVCAGAGCYSPGTTTPAVTVSCLLAGSQTVNSNAPFTIDSSAAGGGGSSNSYGYVWSVGNGVFYPPNHVYAISNTGSTAVPYTVYVEATSGSGTSPAVPCGSVTVNGSGSPSTGSPTLWIGSTAPGVTQTSIRQGSSATVGYTWPSGMSCTGEQANTGTPSLTQTFTGQSLSPGATSQFRSMALGVYQLYLSCTGNSSNDGPAVTSNTIEIDVTPSSVKEQ